jgi:hypothetical protein
MGVCTRSGYEPECVRVTVMFGVCAWRGYVWVGSVYEMVHTCGTVLINRQVFRAHFKLAPVLCGYAGVPACVAFLGGCALLQLKCEYHFRFLADSHSI